MKIGRLAHNQRGQHREQQEIHSKPPVLFVDANEAQL